MNKYLLLTSCSKRKRQLNNKPAIEVYDGPLFKAIRKHFDTTLPQVDIYILSSKYGLISSGTLIKPYDQEMTPDQALEIQSDVTSSLAQIIKEGHYSEVLVNLLASYRLAVNGIEEVIPDNTSIIFLKGPIGKRTSDIIQWIKMITAGTEVGK